MANEVTDLNAPAEPASGAPAPADGPREKSLDEMTDTELIRAAHEMEKRFPRPHEDDCKPDCQWFMDNEHELLRLYPDEFVAIHGGAVIAHGTNVHRVNLEAARKLNISPQRFIVEFVRTSFI